jgi:hypothetical protein
MAIGRDVIRIALTPNLYDYHITNVKITTPSGTQKATTCRVVRGVSTRPCSIRPGLP